MTTSTNRDLGRTSNPSKDAGNELRFDQASLPNGLKVIGEHNPRAASVAAGFFVRTGSRDEGPEVSGVSHFLEHMLFKGNARYSADDLNRIFDELGARYNAFTNFDETVYYGAVLPERLPELLELLGELMRPSIRPDAFEMEKKVILEEIAMYEDRPHFHVFDLATERYWNGHPLGNSVLGTTRSIGELGRDAMMSYFERNYAASNQILTLSGNYDWQQALAQAEAMAGAWPDFPVGRLRPPATPLTGREGTVRESLNRTHVAYSAPGIAATDQRRFAAAILAVALGDDDGSRLYWALVDRGLADSASLGHQAHEDQGVFAGYISAAPERAEQVIATYREVLSGAQDEGVTEAEWRRAQRKLATALTLGSETPLGRLVMLGNAYLTHGRYFSVAEVVDNYLGAGLEQGLALLAERPFDRAFIYTLGPGGRALN